VISWIRWSAPVRPGEPSGWLSRARTAALKAQHVRWQTAQGTSMQVVHFRLRDFQPRALLGWRGKGDVGSWSKVGVLAVVRR